MSKMITREYTECGVPNIWVQCRRIIDNAGEETDIFPAINQLHKLIATEIINSVGALTGPEIRYLRSMIGWTQAQLGEYVHRKRLTISRWENDESTVDGAVDGLIRILAMDKLKLKRTNPQKISRKYKISDDGKDPIWINYTNAGKYRKAA